MGSESPIGKPSPGMYFRAGAEPRVFAEIKLEYIPIMIILQYEANRPHIVHLIPNAMKTSMLALFALALLGTAERATAQTADKKAARKEKKELRQSIDRARHSRRWPRFSTARSYCRRTPCFWRTTRGSRSTFTGTSSRWRAAISAFR